MEDEWISAAEALSAVGNGSIYVAAQAICARAHDGVIVAKAQTLIMGDRRMQDVSVPANFWWARGHAALEQNWQSGDFDTWIGNRLHCRAYGVTFLRRDIVAMLPADSSSRNEPQRTSQGNYAPASRCIKELQGQLNCTSTEAAAHILRFCKAGLVETRCANFWFEATDLIGSKEETFENVAIPSWFWDKCTDDGPDTILDWKSGTFAGRGKVGIYLHRARVRGAEFNISGIVDLETMLRSQNSSGQPEPEPSAPPDARDFHPASRGGRPKSENWVNWIAELVGLVHEQGIPDGSGAEGQDALIALIEERLAARDLESPSRSTVQPAVRAALLRLRSAGN